jgi:arginyl-tRNA synthetase
MAGKPSDREVQTSERVPPNPIDADLYCLECGYNLRGLFGDPIRCPECGTRNALAELRGMDPEAQRRHWALQTALDLSFLGLLLFVGGAISSVLAPPCFLIIVAIAFAMLLLAEVELRRLCSPRRGWVRAMGRYLAWTTVLVLTVPALWVGGSLICWRVTAILGIWVEYWPLHVVVGGVLCAVALAIHDPFTVTRARQADAFSQLLMCARASFRPPSQVSLRRPGRADSLTRDMKHDNLINILKARFAAAVGQVAGTAPEQTDPQIRPATDPKFGDYQCNVAMSLAKPLKAKPRDIAQRIVDAVSLEDIANPLEIAGPGFINIRLSNDFLARYLGDVPAPPAEGTDAQRQAGAQDRLGMPPVEQPQTVVIDYSQPNIAKQMHVGHLRSTIIGDALARVLSLEGHTVIRQNHIGDWGTQFGMLICWYREHPLPTPETHGDVLEAIEADYKAANERFQSDPAFARDARRAVVALQSGEPEARQIWERLCAESWRAFTEIYERLGALLQPSDVRGESFYNDWLPDVIREMRKRLPPDGDGGQLAGVRAEVRDDAGAVCVFMYDDQGQPRFTNRDGSILPMIIQKSDGGYNYDTTDLAALRYRIDRLGATRILYVVDVSQTPHFEMLFTAARAAGLIPPDVEAVHVKFGMVLGKGGKRIKTREGKNITLRELLEEAEQRAYELLESRAESTKARSDEPPEPQAPAQGPAAVGAEPTEAFTAPEKREVARRVGIASVKYADLRNDRQSNYVFDWDKMITFQGNTAPYMMYAYARIRSIYRKAAERFGEPNVYASDVALALDDPAERAVALRLARLRETLDVVAGELTPHVLCGYLYELATDFMRFYEACPVLRAPDEATRLSRMRLCDLTARTLELGLGLLGIEVIERM